jgi:hypothetical protein
MMAHVFTFKVTVTTERTAGKFAPRDEQAAEITTMLEAANEGSIYGIGADGETEYEITDWSVSEE